MAIPVAILVLYASVLSVVVVALSIRSEPDYADLVPNPDAIV